MGYSTPQFNDGHQGNLCSADGIYLGWDADKRWQRPPKGHQGGRRGPVVWIKGGNVGRGNSCLQWEAAPVSGDQRPFSRLLLSAILSALLPTLLITLPELYANSPMSLLSRWPWVVMWTQLEPNSYRILHINYPEPKAKMWRPGVPKIKSCLRISRTFLKSRVSFSNSRCKVTIGDHIRAPDLDRMNNQK